MIRRLQRTVTVLLTGLWLTSAMALAAEGTLSGSVQNVDPQQGRLIVREEPGDSMVDLRAPTDLLTGLQVGDVIEVKRLGQQATFIRRKGEVQRPEFGGVLQPQPPGEGPRIP